MENSLHTSIEIDNKINSVEILSPEQLDDRIQREKFPKNLTRAWTVMPLSRYLDDTNGLNMGVSHWIQTLPVESKQLGFGPWKSTKEVFSQEDIIETWSQLRRYYGWQSGMSDLLRREYPEAANIVYQGKYSGIVSLGRIYKQFVPLDDWEKVAKMVEEGNTHPNWKISPEDVRASTDLLKTAFSSVDLVDHIYSLAEQRQGVQVIYGNTAFRDYLSNAGHDRSIDSVVGNAMKLNCRIPSAHITAVVPLGSYEQTKLLGHT